MSEKKTDTPERVYSTAELVAAIRICHSGEGGCDGCPMAPYDAVRCSGMETMVADRLEELAAQVKQLTEATEKAAKEKIRKLVGMAAEANTALERGLEGANQAQLAEMTVIQDELEAFGRCSSIRAEPAGRQDGSMRIAEVVVGGVTVYGGDADG